MIYFSEWVRHTTSFRNLLNTSRGRDKFCQWWQYLSAFYITCMRESEVWGELVRQKSVGSVNKAKKLENSLSSGRKIFRLFLWLNELSTLDELYRSKTPFDFGKILKIVSSSLGLGFYISDNALYLANLGFISKFVPLTNQLKWKQIKNLCSLFRTIVELIYQVKQFFTKHQDEQKSMKELEKLDNSIVEWSSQANVHLRAII